MEIIFKTKEDAEDYKAMGKMYKKLCDIMMEDQIRFFRAIKFLSYLAPNPEDHRREFKVIQGGD
jgi:hypothetical protein